MYHDQLPVIDLPRRMEGRFKLRRVKAASGIIVEETDWIPNLLVNGFFDDRLNSSGSDYYYKGYIVGSGTNAAAETDTALQAYVGGGASCEEVWTVRNATVSPRYIRHGMRFRSTEGGAAGNLSEIAMYSDTSNNTTTGPAATRRIHSRARIVDGAGNPTTITVLSDEFLDVIYEITMYAIEDVTGVLTVNIDGTPTNIDYTLRSVHMLNTSGWSPANKVSTFAAGAFGSFLPATTNGTNECTLRAATYTSLLPYDGSTAVERIASNIFNSRVSVEAYVNGSKTRRDTRRLPLNNGNIGGGFQSIIIPTGQAGTSWGLTQMLLASPIPKVATKLFDLPIRVTLTNG